MSDNSTITKLIFRKDIVVRSVRIGLIVGTILNLINQGDKLFANGEFDVFRCVLTYLVPYCIATYSAVMVASG
ncbi:MAG: nitrate/nitrite transporter NrtS [Pseudomonadota bacterium]